MPYEKRVSLYNSVLNQINNSKAKQEQYKNYIPPSNDRLTGFVQNLEQQCKRFVEIEAKRCEQVHSSIGQYVVFEKFCEMNNKYDIKNFSDLIDTFKVESEMKIVQENVRINMISNRFKIK